MTRFRYFQDRLFVAAAAGYVLNRFLLAPLIASPFLRGHCNDLLLMPAALPVVLWLQRRLAWRRHDFAPTWGEMGLHLLVWSAVCEFFGPRWLGRGTADWWDIVAYAVGGIVACWWWNRSVRSTSRA